MIARAGEVALLVIGVGGGCARRLVNLFSQLVQGIISILFVQHIVFVDLQKQCAGQRVYL